MQFPGKLIDRSLDFALLTSALLDHQLYVLVVQDADEVALGVAVVQGDVVQLEDVPVERNKQEELRHSESSPSHSGIKQVPIYQSTHITKTVTGTFMKLLCKFLILLL